MKRITKSAENEFIIEFDKKAAAESLTPGFTFEHEGARYVVVHAYPGVVNPGCYTFLVITKTLA